MDEERVPPVISVCMPYYNGASMSGDRQALLDVSLAAYRRLYDVEISICDDGSPVPVNAPGCVVTSLPTKDYALNPCVPINRAVDASSGDVIVLTNPEIEHREDVFSRMLEALEPGGYVTASCRDRSRWIAHSSIPHEASALRAPRPEGSQFHFCAMFHRELWDKAGGFDEDYREGHAFDDNDWLWRVEDVGARFVHLDDCVVYHTHTGTKWPKGGWERNAMMLASKWGHKWQR